MPRAHTVNGGGIGNGGGSGRQGREAMRQWEVNGGRLRDRERGFNFLKMTQRTDSWLVSSGQENLWFMVHQP